MTMYAWATPAFVNGSPVDHTWVTTFDNNQQNYVDENAVIVAGEDYWFCWGSYHPTGTGLGNQPGNLPFATCLVVPNVDSNTSHAARGTIFTYGVDGVCHQLANQVLYATGPTPMTVRNARGYMASTFIYGTYGLQNSAWASKVQSCSSPSGGGGGLSLAPGGILPVDDFEKHARTVLVADPLLLNKLLALRADVHSFAGQKIPGSIPPNAATLNARNQHLIQQAAVLLGPQKFELVFGFPPDQEINLVDPAVNSGP